MDAIEKVLNSLIDSMHKHIAIGNGNKRIDTKHEIKEAVHDVPDKKPRELTAFDHFLQKGKDRKSMSKRTEMVMSIGKPNIKKKKP